jgi:hypothetical protein
MGAVTAVRRTKPAMGSLLDTDAVRDRSGREIFPPTTATTTPASCARTAGSLSNRVSPTTR